MQKFLNLLIENPIHPILADVFIPEKNNGKLILFCHGFKGFKDWGPWLLVAKAFAKAGFIFVKFNFSHNGIGIDKTSDFTRLDLFEQNNYTKEVDEVKRLVSWIKNDGFWEDKEVKEINIIGHSRGGGIALVGALENKEISKVATWASIGNFNRFGSVENVDDWQRAGFKNFYNSRTHQDMRIGIQFYQDYIKNVSRLDIEKTCKVLNKPLLLVHGKMDDAVGFSHAQRIKKWSPNASLYLLEDANHVFNAKHPFVEEQLPKALENVVAKTIEFFLKR